MTVSESGIPACFWSFGSKCHHLVNPAWQGGPGGKASLDSPGHTTVARGARGTSEVLSGATARGRRLLSSPASWPWESRWVVVPRTWAQIDGRNGDKYGIHSLE